MPSKNLKKYSDENSELEKTNEKVKKTQNLKDSIAIANKIKSKELNIANLAQINEEHFPMTSLPQKRANKTINRKSKLNSIEKIIEEKMNTKEVLQETSDLPSCLVEFI